jgi:hypothetical protein
MVGARLVCPAGGWSFGAGWKGASAGCGGGNGGDAAVDALEACSGKARSAVIMKKARLRMHACGSSVDGAAHDGHQVHQPGNQGVERRAEIRKFLS